MPKRGSCEHLVPERINLPADAILHRQARRPAINPYILHVTTFVHVLVQLSLYLYTSLDSSWSSHLPLLLAPPKSLVLA